VINWQLPIRRKRDGSKARWLGTIRRKDGLNFVVAVGDTSSGEEAVGTFTIEGSKLGTDKWDLENYDAE
jgi:hypothetical protein